MATTQQQSVVGKTDAGKRLDVVAAAHFGVSRSSLGAAFAADKLLLNGLPAKPRAVVAVGDRLDLNFAPIEKAVFAAPDLHTVYEDDDMVVVDKPAGLLVHATEHDASEATVSDFSAGVSTDDEDPDRAGIVHRLDRDTSGLLVIAKTGEAKKFLQQQFRDRQVYKSYIALVRGRLQEAEATINLPIGRDRKQPTRRAVVPGGRPAVTHYEVLAEYDGASLVRITLETGRTHQIRVHFAHLGHPVIGDRLYGQDQAGLDRQFLHAVHMRLTGPHGQGVDVRSPLPDDLRHYLETLGAVPEGV